MIAIVNYGLGNLRSVAGAIERLGFEGVITNDPDELLRADKLILPGVGAFGDGMKNIRDLDLIKTLNHLALEERKPILGICLGFQLMAEESFEFGEYKGLNWINAKVEKIKTEGKLRLPHVGWNDFFQCRPSLLFEGVPEEALFYYVHSYAVNCQDHDVVAGECEYGVRFTAAVEQDNIFGTQFHPEKSQKWGLKVISNFLEKA
ncbi:imidazole glycerol phosphate synthase subunit HisH [Thermodesulfobacteriota bacterium]